MSRKIAECPMCSAPLRGGDPVFGDRQVEGVVICLQCAGRVAGQVLGELVTTALKIATRTGGS